ncbi:MAG TPA: hypothetical protein VHT74_16655, partial [Acetobacteraceae bacterium]|nr:hypothetical protein [Acetobacteraceae bacterium]
TMWIEGGNTVLLPKVARTVVIPSAEEEAMGAMPDPPAFDPMDPSDEETFTFDWSQHANPGDPIASATVSVTPSDLMLAGPAGVNGLQVQVTCLPSGTPGIVYGLRCSVTYQSNRKGNWTIPLPIQAL